MNPFKVLLVVSMKSKRKSKLRVKVHFGLNMPGDAHIAKPLF